MPRYIDAEFALRFYQDICKGIACYECQMRDDDGACKIEDYLRSLPTADVVPVRHEKWILVEEPMGWEDVDCAMSQCGADPRQ